MGYADATNFMLRQPDRTVFAVQMNGLLVHGETVGHWLNAIKVAGEIRYFDFQVNTPHIRQVAQPTTTGKNAASCRMPFVGIVTTKARLGHPSLHSSDPALPPGMYDTKTVSMNVLAFAPKRK
jgi:hypothetical protein